LFESVDEQNPKFSAQNHIFIHTIKCEFSTNENDCTHRSIEPWLK